MSSPLQSAKSVAKQLQDAGFIAYFAGGYVRDLIMNHPSDDIDIATDASVAEIQELFPKTIPVGVAFGIVIVVHEEHHFEVATFRKDRGYSDGRRPEGIDPTTPIEDAKRRDFTINGLFYDPLTEEIFDYVGGQDDIEKKVIRAIGNPHERFLEDRLRMMRAVRYSTRFNFAIDPATLSAIQTHARDLLPAVAMERVWQEFKKMSQFAHFDTGLILLHELGLLPTIFPSLKTTSLTIIQERVRFIELFPKGSPTFAELLELFPDHDLDQVFELSEYLKLSNKEKAFARFYHHASALLSMPPEWLAKLERFEWAQFYADPYSEIGLGMLAAKASNPDAFIQTHQQRQRALQLHIDQIRAKRPYLSADHLIEAGVPPGPRLGELIEEGWRLAINQQVTEPNALIELLQQSPLWPSPSPD